MSVRRLAKEQPASFAFSAENLAWAQATIAKYPAGKQASAVIPLLTWAKPPVGRLAGQPITKFAALNGVC